MSVDAAGLFSPMASALSVAVLNALWQGTLIGAITAGVFAAMRRRSAQVRYCVACLSLAAMLVAFAATFSVALGYAEGNAHQTTSADGVSVGAVAETPPPPLEWWPGVPTATPQGLGGISVPVGGPWLAAAWLLGMAVVALFSTFQFAELRRLTASVRFEVSDGWRDAFEAMARDPRIDRLVRLGHSAAVEVPTVVGWLAPIVLVPLSLSATLSPDAMCAILAHELAHIRRRDYLVNVVQKVIEAVLFFHPVTWWLSHRIRVEREYCCDDVAVHYTNSALVYARALSQLETLRAQRRGYAMGADGGSLMNRITRIVGAKPQRIHLSVIGTALGALVVAMAGMAFMVVGNAGAAPGTTATASPTATAALKAAPPADTNAAAGFAAAARSALDQLVANGTINQSQADALDQQLATGDIDEALVSSGLVTDAQMQAVGNALGQVKRSFASANPGALDKQSPAGTLPECDRISAKLTQAVKDSTMTQEQANQQLASAGCTAADMKP